MKEKKSTIEQVLLRFKSGIQDSRESLSAVALTPGNYLWLGCDETSSIERLSYSAPNTFENHEHFVVADFVPPITDTDKEIDIEGLDYADGYLWLVGSHSLKRKKPNSKKTDLENIQNLAIIEPEKNRFLLARIPLVGDRLYKSCPHPENPEKQLTAAKLENTKSGNCLTDALLEDPHLAPFLKANIPGKDNGFDIEGLAVYKNKIFLGLRGPVLRGWAIVLEIKVKEINSTSLKLKKVEDKRYKKHFIDLDGLGVRDLCIDGQDLLILAGPTMDIDGPVRIYRLENGVNLPENVLSKPTPILDIPYGDGEDHAEGMTFFPTKENQKSLIVLYDSPAKKTRLQGDDSVLADIFQL
ncbi:DUF3616 domain-containing protein [Argonema antarcticum]|uniref:DUF3616 domain-containing protein n=1 Tax=Argonema antarcticum TaxID=2942763 RepID=UPI00201312C8|nr:DUF3616 domain-containing protein [Argonema antarcticum]MCL1471126.1 DUF3616 domain-containing protein [Argonema antarcticum A004/B2]